MDETTSASRDEAAIRRIVQDWAKAVRGKDLEGILRAHATSMLLFDVPPPFQSRGIDAYRESWNLFFSANDPVVFNIAEMNITAGTDVAFATAVMNCSEVAAGGESIALDFRLTIGLRKIDDRWTIVHEHHSIPATH